MTRRPDATTRRPPAASLRHLTVIALTVLLAMHMGSTASLAQEAPVGLGTAEGFSILAGSTITNTGSSTVTGDVGLHPGTAVTGFGPGADEVTLNGSLHVADGVALQAKSDLGTAYTDAAGRTPVTEIPTELGGQTLMAGVYDSAAGTFGVTGTLTLDGAGDPDSVFIFQMGSTLTTASASSVSLINGADVCNVYWQVGSSATLGSNSDFLGTIMAAESITLTNGASVQGRVLARSGAVTLDSNTITNEACATPTGDTPVEDEPTDEAPVEDEPTDEAAAEDDAATDDDGAVSGEGEEDAPAAGDSPTDGETTSQIQEVPGGSVAAGGGDLEATSSTWSMLLAAMLVLLLAGGTVGAIARQRVRE